MIIRATPIVAGIAHGEWALEYNITDIIDQSWLDSTLHSDIEHHYEHVTAQTLTDSEVRHILESRRGG